MEEDFLRFFLEIVEVDGEGLKLKFPIEQCFNFVGVYLLTK